MRVLNYLELAGHLDRAGIGTAAAHQRKALADRAEVDVITSPWTGRRLVYGLARLAVGGRAWRDFDLAHCNLFGPGSVAVARRARREGIPLVLHAHTTSEDFRDSFRGSNRLAPALRRYLRWFYSRADLVLCPSEYTKSNLLAYPVEAPIRTVTNGVDLESLAGFEAFREAYRERYDLEGMVPFLVGNVFERKGLTTFCRLAEATDYDFAWFGAYDTGPHASAEVNRWVGDPPENVTFTGWVEDKRGMFAAGDVLLFPTKDENQGIAVLEAMACGTACVLSDIPVFREFFEDGHDCLLCSGFAEYREALRRLEADPDLRARLGANARETAQEHSLDRVGEELVDAYRSLLGPGDGPGTEDGEF
jgi:glycosyltransferase involved in cell wall biosynthesis